MRRLNDLPGALIRVLLLPVVLYDCYALAVLVVLVWPERPHPAIEPLSWSVFFTSFALPFATFLAAYALALLAGLVILFNFGQYRTPLCRLALLVNTLLVAAMAPSWSWWKESVGATNLFVVVPLASCMIFAAHEIVLRRRSHDGQLFEAES